MRFKLKNLENEIFTKREGLAVGDDLIGVLKGSFFMNRKELERTKRRSKEIWDRVYDRSGIKHFEGHVRFDFVPRFEGDVKREGDGYDLGSLRLPHLYEINTHSPEGMACDALYRKVFPDLANGTPSASKKLAETLKLRYGSHLKMVKGKGNCKKAWVGEFVGRLAKYGLQVDLLSPQEAKEKKPDVLWRWGDVDFTEFCNEFSPDFQNWLLKAKKNSTHIFNTVPEDSTRDVANKRFLAKSKDIILDREKDLKRAVEADRREYVLKPLRGASGKGIQFGDNYPPADWRRKLRTAYENNKKYGLFKKFLLPELQLGDRKLAIDFLPSFYAEGKELEFLYVLVRAEPYSSYLKTKKINVARGGGYGGTVSLI